MYVLKTGHLKFVYTQLKSISSTRVGLNALKEILIMNYERRVNKLHAIGPLHTEILLNPIMRIYDAIF
jgi:hypothetical protein